MTRDPFLVEPPALISFSGGRTSGYMLRRILDAHAGSLPSNVHVLFANTGKELPATLDFVSDVQGHWGISVRWLERPVGGGYREVDYGTASRDGRPFREYLEAQPQNEEGRRLLPNPTMPVCSTELKTRVMKHWMLAQGYEHWTSVVGIRADEPRRAARYRDRQTRERWDVDLPLVTAGLTVVDVRAFWATQPFDLRLQPWEGNCDLCFQKGRAKRERILRDHPELAQWWIDREEYAGDYFRRDIGSVRHSLGKVAATPLLTLLMKDSPAPSGLDDLGDCECNEQEAA